MAIQIGAFTSGDDVFVHWRRPTPIEKCLGFALFRRRNGTEACVDNYIGFKGDGLEPPQPSTTWPMQRFRWTDHLVDSGDTVAYRVVARVGGSSSSLADGEASPWTPDLTVTGGSAIAVYFNRGIVATQWVSRLLEGTDKTSLNARLDHVIQTVGDPVRGALSGYDRTRLLELLAGAKTSGAHVYAAVYELDDRELIDGLLALKGRAHVVLANGSKKRVPHSSPARYTDENRDARTELKQAGVKVYDRLVVDDHLGHNKFAVVAHGGKPERVWTGSTNWTKTGLCTQANNALVVEDPGVAARFKKQWDRLKQAKSDYPTSLAKADDTPAVFDVAGASITVWFAPTTAEAELDHARQLLAGAKHAVLFLMFNPGPRNTLLNTILDLRAQKEPDGAPRLYIRGVINQDPGGKKAPVLRYGPETDAVPLDKTVLLPAAIESDFDFWRTELRKYAKGWAMVHSKVVVIDPFTDHPVLITGSHNLGPKASRANDENLVVIEGDKAAAQAHACTIMSVYDTYHWREWQLQFRATGKPNPGSHLHTHKPWQDWPLVGGGRRETDLWFGGP